MSDSKKSLADRVTDDVGGAFTVGLAYIGDRLGLFAGLTQSGPCSSGELAQRTALDERYVREWLHGMVASRYVEHDAVADAYFLNEEQRAALADESSRTFQGGVFQFALPSLLLTPRLMEAFRRGGGIAYEQLPPEIPAALDRMHRPWFDHLLTQEWLPAAPSLIAGFAAGISALDVGCGRGRSTVAMARAFPNSTFIGIDPHPPSIDAAEVLAASSRLSNARFRAVTVEQQAAGSERFDFIVAIDCIHDMVAPIEALRAIRNLLRPNGVFFWSEPTGSASPMENRDPHGKVRANLSSYHCLTVSLAAGGAGLGTIIGETGVRDLAARAGFPRVEKLPVLSDTQQFFLLPATAE